MCSVLMSIGDVVSGATHYYRKLPNVISVFGKVLLYVLYLGPIPCFKRKMKIAAAIFIPVIFLSLLTWWFFFVSGDPLTPAETTLVVGVYFTVILSARWLWGYLHSKKGKT